MSDLKLNGVTPDGIGKIKLGSADVQKVYSGSTLVWPTGEVNICGYIWTAENSTITDTTSGGTIPIAANATEFLAHHNAAQPVAMYLDFDSNNSERGLLYNQYAARVIQPPTGFLVPSTLTFDQTFFGTCNPSSPNQNRYGANPGNWNSNLNFRDELGNTGLNFNGYGEAVLNSLNGTVLFTRDTTSSYQLTTTRIGTGNGPNVAKVLGINQQGQFRTLILTEDLVNINNRAGYIRFYKLA